MLLNFTSVDLYSRELDAHRYIVFNGLHKRESAVGWNPTLASFFGAPCPDGKIDLGVSTINMASSFFDILPPSLAERSTLED